MSRLGLDKLAKEKREERERAAESEAKKIKLQDSARQNQDVDMEGASGSNRNRREDESDDRGSMRVMEPRYRTKRMETPSHPGGVSQDALRRVEERKSRARGGLYDRAQDSRDRDYDRDSRDRDRDRNGRGDSRYDRSRDGSSRDRDRDWDRDRYGSSDRYRDDRSRDRRDDRDDRRSTDRRDDRPNREAATPRRSDFVEPRSQRVNRSDWDATPSRTGRSTDNVLQGGLTPRRGMVYSREVFKINHIWAFRT